MSNQLKKLVVYYSLDGTTAAIAKTIADTVGADVLELRPKNPITAKGFLRMLLGGLQVYQKKQQELLPFDKNPAEYDLLFIGTPVWFINYTPVLRTFFGTTRLQQKRIAVFCCYAGNPAKVLDKMKRALSGNTIVGEQKFAQGDTTKTQKAAEWAKKIAADASGS